MYWYIELRRFVLQKTWTTKERIGLSNTIYAGHRPSLSERRIYPFDQCRLFSVYWYLIRTYPPKTNVTDTFQSDLKWSDQIVHSISRYNLEMQWPKVSNALWDLTPLVRSIASALLQALYCKYLNAIGVSKQDQTIYLVSTSERFSPIQLLFEIACGKKDILLDFQRKPAASIPDKGALPEESSGRGVSYMLSRLKVCDVPEDIVLTVCRMFCSEVRLIDDAGCFKILSERSPAKFRALRKTNLRSLKIG